VEESGLGKLKILSRLCFHRLREITKKQAMYRHLGAFVQPLLQWKNN